MTKQYTRWRSAWLIALVIVCAPVALADVGDIEDGTVDKKGAAAEVQKRDAKPQPKESTKEEVHKQIRELERELAEKRREFERAASREHGKPEQHNKKKSVEHIKLPSNPTRAQCETYVAELRDATQGRNSFSTGDPVVEKLKAIPAEHFDLLVIEMSNRSSLRYYANYAMRGTDPKKLRDQFVKSLKKNDQSIGVIVMHGWAADVADTIRQRIATADSSISPAWFQAAVELEDETLYPKLHEITINSRYAYQFLTMLDSLPDYDIAHTATTCWKRSRSGELPISSSKIADIAAKYGNVAALGSIISRNRGSSNYMVNSASYYNSRRMNVLRHIEFRGSNEEIQKWFDKNKDKLVYDHFKKRYVLPEAF